jgi:nitronate monooxygenase
VTGDVDLAPLMVGQSIGLINDIPTCQELLDKMVSDAKVYIDQANTRISLP